MTLKSQITLCKVMGEINNTMLWQGRYREYYVMTGERQRVICNMTLKIQIILFKDRGGIENTTL